MSGIEDWIVFWKLLLVKNCADQNIVDDKSKLLNRAMPQKGEIGQSYLLELKKDVVKYSEEISNKINAYLIIVDEIWQILSCRKIFSTEYTNGELTCFVFLGNLTHHG